MKDIYIFKRIETKYRITVSDKERLLSLLSDRFTPDPHGPTTVSSVYLDTPDRLLIRNSIEGGVYKEKLRIRGYGDVNDSTDVFFEIKKKYKGVVYKRRIRAPLFKVEEYLKNHTPPAKGQIMSEIDYFMQYYKNPQPAMLISCYREGFFGKDDDGLRITFDTDVRYNSWVPDLRSSEKGQRILEEDYCIMEIKASDSMPIWLSKALSDCALFPRGFSKYGTAHLLSLKRPTVTQGGKI